jgi:hexosaminidase
MIRSFIIVSLAPILAAGCVMEREVPRQGTSDIGVIPIPARVQRLNASFSVNTGTRIVAPADGEAARIARYLADLLERTLGVQLKVVLGDAAFRPANAIVLQLGANGKTSSAEGYELDVKPQGITVSAQNPHGLFYGTVTLWQLLTAHELRSNSIDLPAVHIEDAPQLSWRGFMLDVARHYMPPKFIEQLLDWMALHKLNTFHWHLTDDQGWRLQILKYPQLTDVGALGVSDGFYTQDEVRRIVRYAADRFIKVVPEIEMPGHAQAAIAAYPRLGTEGPAPQVSRDWGIHDYLFNVEEETFQFLEDVLTETMLLFPGEYIHVGGDEAVKNRWHASHRVQQRMRELGVKDEAALQGYFVHRIERFLSGHGRKLIGWDEILEGGLPPHATVMSWRGTQGAIDAARQGHDVVLAPAPTLYLDYLQSDSADEPPGRLSYVTVADVYGFNPIPAQLSEAERRHILGAQLNAWTEHMRLPERVEHNAFPKVAALAEVLWSAPEKRSWLNFRRRLPAQFARYRSLGIEYSDSVFSPARALSRDPLHRRSDELKTCTNKLPLRLEDDAPLQGKRALFNIDILDPCWIFPRANLSRVSRITATVGQLPFNFQVGDDVSKIPLHPPQTPEGELEVHLDSCEGERIAVLPLAPATFRAGVSVLPKGAISPRHGRHDLCLFFTRPALEPMWALESVQLVK